MSKIIALSFALVATGGCLVGFDVANRAPAACGVLSADDIARTLPATSVKQADGSGFNSATGVDTCRWTGDGNVRLELRTFRTDSSAGDALKMVFESSQAYATRPDASGRTRGRALTGVGDDAMLLSDTGSGTSVAFRVGRTGATIIGTGSEDALIELAKRASTRLR
jgi:hypothetical protein